MRYLAAVLVALLAFGCVESPTDTDPDPPESTYHATLHDSTRVELTLYGPDHPDRPSSFRVDAPPWFKDPGITVTGGSEVEYRVSGTWREAPYPDELCAFFNALGESTESCGVAVTDAGLLDTRGTFGWGGGVEWVLAEGGGVL